MNMVDLILKKKAGEALSTEEIRFFAQGAAASADAAAFALARIRDGSAT